MNNYCQNKIKEIKIKLNDYTYDFDTRKDISFLLSIIEKQEQEIKSLKQATNDQIRFADIAQTTFKRVMGKKND